MRIFTIADREIKLGFRNAWTYSFLILLTIFTVAILLLQSGISQTEGYTDMTGTIMNMTLYLLPLITLLLGSVSIASEKEDGEWNLLSTYALSTYTFLWGKWIGLAVIMLTILAFSFGVAGLITFLFGKALTMTTLLLFWVFSSLLSLTYLGIALGVGAISNNRWQALIGSIIVWFLTIITWPIILMSTLHFVSYSWIVPILQISTFLNPAEFVRIFIMMKMGAGSVFGPEYDQWVTWVNGTFGTTIFTAIVIIWIFTTINIGAFLWERRDERA